MGLDGWSKVNDDILPVLVENLVHDSVMSCFKITLCQTSKHPMPALGTRVILIPNKCGKGNSVLTRLGNCVTSIN